jgi:kynurenine formamidase
MGEQDDPALDNAVESIIDALQTMATDDPAAAAGLAEALSSLEEHGPRTAERDREGRAGESEYGSAEGEYTARGRYSDEDEDEYGEGAGARYESPGRDRLPAIKRVMDLSVPVARDLPGGWPSPFLPPFIIMRHTRHGPEPYASEAMVIDEHTGTHWDAPPHFIPPPSTGLPNAADIGNVPSDKVPAWQFVGEACVIDVRKLQEAAKPKVITRQVVADWEAAHRPLGPGDIVLFRSDYSDKYYRPLPAGRRYVADPLQGAAPPWSGVDPDCMAYLAGKKVGAVGIDAPNIGPASADAIATHVVGLSAGVLLVENLINLRSLPGTGAFAAILGPKHANGSGGEGRVLAVVEAEAAERLIGSARLQKVADLSVLLREDLPCWWPGAGVGNYRTPYLSRTLHSWEQPGGPALVRTHILDGQVGTHVVTPSYSVPRPGFDFDRYDEKTRRALERFEELYGPLGTSRMTVDRVPLGHLAGAARVIDVKHLVGTAAPGRSPTIRISDIHRHEKRFGRIRAGEVVIFHSGHSDRFYQPFPYGSRCIADPLNGQAEGWPAPEPETVVYLDAKGVRCVGTDAPSMGASDPAQALLTYWAAGSRGMCFVEYLTGVGQIPPTGAYFLFAPVKIKRGNGGYGRALALF